MFKHHSFQRLSLLSLLGVTSLALIAATGCNRDPNVRKQKYLESGDRYEKAGKYKEASIQYANAIKIDGNFAAAHYAMGKTYLAMGNPLAAYQEFLKTVDLKPGDLKARIDLGQMQMEGGIPDKAAEQAKAVLAIDPKNADAYALLSGVARKKSDADEAIKNLQQALVLDPSRSEFHSQLAMLQASDPKTSAGATDELRKAIQLDPKNVMAHLALSAMLERSGDKSGAEQEDLAAIKAVPESIPARASLAGFYRRAGDTAKVEQTLLDTADSNPDNPDATGLLKDYYFQTRQLDKAESTYESLRSKHPKSLNLRIAYAEVLATRNEYDKLRPIVADLNKSNGSEPEVQLLNSAILLKDSKINEAYDLLQKAVKNAPENVSLQIAMAKVAGLKGDSALSETSYTNAVKLQPRNIEAETGMAAIANRKGDSAMLTQIAERTLSFRPDFIDAYLWRATAEANQKQYDKAAADLQTVIARDPKNAAAKIELGQVYLRQGRTADANVLLVGALDDNPDTLPALHLLVTEDMTAKQPEKAVSRIKEQIAKSPKNANLWNELALVQGVTKDFKGERDSAHAALAIDPNNMNSVQLFTQAATQLGDTDGALAVWQQWDAAHPNNPQSTSMVAMLENQKGDTNKAMEYYKKSLQLQPDQAMAQNNLAYLMVETGQNVDNALSLAQSARRTLPHSAETADTLAWVYYHKDRFSTAKELLEEALKDNPDNASMHYHLGLVYNKLSDKAGAAKELKKAVSLNPETPVGKQAAEALAKLS